MPIRVLIVDDSALIREILTNLLSRDPDLLVVGSAHDPYDAREKIKRLDPDVITLDINMPHMNGIAFLERLMRLRPLPVVMVSTLTRKDEDVTLLALELGAVDFLAKPVERGEDAWERAGGELRAKVKAAASARVGPARSTKTPSTTSRVVHHPRALVAIGASTGGVEAIHAILTKLPQAFPPVAITQHMPAGFTARFAQRLDETSSMRVREASDGEEIGLGDAVIAPGDMHFSIDVRNGRYVCRVEGGEPVSGHRPSVDVLFRSVAAAAGPHAVGLILTGMGRDGARGLLALREAGGRTLGQSEASCLVYGMPRAAKELGAVMSETPLEEMPERLLAELAAPIVHAA